MSGRLVLKRALSQCLINRRAVFSLSATARSAMSAGHRSSIQTSQLPKKMYATSASVSSLEASQAELLHKSNLAVREIVLNRPKKLNALTVDTIHNIAVQLQAYEKSELAKIIVIKHSGGRSFCAGGDIKSVKELSDKNDPQTPFIFEKEYQLNHLIGTLETPYVALVDGITMGGGVGLSTHAPFCVATENTLFAMPETAIGFFPDAGGSFFLSRLDGHLGVYIGMTGKRLKGVDAFYAGVASHYVPSSRLNELEARLAELENPTHDMINQAIEEYSAELNTESAFSLGGPIRQSIDRCFQYDNVEEIVQAVEREEPSAWKDETLKALRSMSPTSLKTALQQIRNGRDLSLAQCLKMEYRLAQKILFSDDFREGVDATLIRRTEANWNPKKLEDVDANWIKREYFDYSSQIHLNLLNKRDFKEYPHRKFCLPSEQDIMRVVTGETPDVGNYALNRQEVVEYFLRDRKGKQGVKEKVLEVLDRKTKENEKDSDKSLKWVYEI
ncbi:ClpP/crotonase-like domain-containing protein [Sporodiniella umbellata]|nr:ClpP/crotonase-like domain-containing protein [Sporodiniella umbellata]